MSRAHAWITVLLLAAAPSAGGEIEVVETDDQILIRTDCLEAVVRKKGYVSGVAGGSLLDRKTGFRDAGHGLDIADFILEPGSDEADRDQLPERLVYSFGNPVHGDIPKRMIEGPQICTQARELSPRIIRGEDLVALVMDHTFTEAAPGRKPGSRWTQTLVFPADTRYFVSSQRIDAVNSSPAMFFRIDMPGHVKHVLGNTFSEIYLSYFPQTIPAGEFFESFPPDARFLYRRGTQEKPPERFIRAYHLRDAETGRSGPWLAGMTLDPSDVHEAWCHQRPAGNRGYVCMIEEFGGRPIRPGESFSAAFVVGYFDSIDRMHEVYDRHAGHSGLEVDASGWRLTE